MTEKDPIRSTVAILQESLDTIMATYWIKGDGFTFEPWALADGPKIIKAQMSDKWSGGYVTGPEHQVKITGVCSIGALALATYTLYDEPLDSFTRVSERDPMTWAAAAALVACMTPDWYRSISDIASAIAEWNDNELRTREEVIDLFKRAIEHPLATADTIYGIEIKWSDNMTACQLAGFNFASEAEANEFIEGLERLRTWRAALTTQPEPALTEAQQVFVYSHELPSSITPFVAKEVTLQSV